jgi:hypothetical protein
MVATLIYLFNIVVVLLVKQKTYQTKLSYAHPGKKGQKPGVSSNFVPRGDADSGAGCLNSSLHISKNID